MKIKDVVYEVGASSAKDGKEVFLLAFSEVNLKKDPNWIKVQK